MTSVPTGPATAPGKSLQMTPARPAPDAQDARLQKAARALETTFLAEMLGHAGLGAASESFGGGAGEEQFASFLREAQAAQIVEKGGIGLAERLFQALKRGSHD